MKKHSTNERQQRGFTLVELMVAMTLGLLILSAAISMFISNKRVYTEQDEMGRLQENARFALDLLLRDIRMAGYSGCADDIDEVSVHVTGHDDATSIFFFLAVEGFESGAATWQPSASTDEVGNMRAGTDAITVRYLAPTGIFPVVPYMTTASAAMHITTDSGLEKGDIIAVSDCQSADVVVMTSDPSEPGCSSTTDSTCKSTFNHHGGSPPGARPWNDYSGGPEKLSKTYGGDARILKFTANRYYIGNDADGDPVLRRMSGVDKTAGTPLVEDLIEGVENLQILYGEDTGSDMIADVYRNANAVVDWDKVVSVRLSLLFQTVEEYGTEQNTATYDLLGTSFDPTDDRHRRRVFTATVGVRNRSS